MQITVQSTTRESKKTKNKNQTYWGVKHSDGNWYNLIVDAKPSQGQTFDVDVKTREFQGKTYRWAEIVKKPAASHATGNGNGAAVSWTEYELMMSLAHHAATQLEPDSDIVDRSTARAALVNTVMIAFTNGKIVVDKEDENEPPPPDDSEAPF